VSPVVVEIEMVAPPLTDTLTKSVPVIFEIETPIDAVELALTALIIGWLIAGLEAPASAESGMNAKRSVERATQMTPERVRRVRITEQK
jgi:hypothetical protein